MSIADDLEAAVRVEQWRRKTVGRYGETPEQTRDRMWREAVAARRAGEKPKPPSLLYPITGTRVVERRMGITHEVLYSQTLPDGYQEITLAEVETGRRMTIWAGAPAGFWKLFRYAYMTSASGTHKVDSTPFDGVYAPSRLWDSTLSGWGPTEAELRAARSRILAADIAHEANRVAEAQRAGMAETAPELLDERRGR